MRTTQIDRRPARGLFHWQQVEGPTRRNHQTTYLVWGKHREPPAGRQILGAIQRVKGGWAAYPRGERKFLTTSTNGVFPTREAASIGLVQYLNRYEYGRERLDRAKITTWRTPR